MSDRLTDALKYFCEKLRSTVEGGNEVSIITHLDADGIARLYNYLLSLTLVLVRKPIFQASASVSER